MLMLPFVCTVLFYDQQDGDWSLLCPNECPGLADVHSAEFDALYTRYAMLCTTVDGCMVLSTAMLTKHHNLKP
jgi:hypothetical protein